MASLPLHLTEFRTMQESDLSQVMLIENQVYNHPWSRGIFLDCIRGDYICRVLVDGEKLLGYSIMSAAVGEAHLLNICVDPQQQSKGIGRYLIFKVIDDAKEEDAESLFLEVRPSNTHALNLYESLGFMEVGRRKGYYPAIDGREDALVLALDVRH